MAEKWSSIVQSASYKRMSSRQKKNAKRHFWNRVRLPTLKRQHLTDSAIAAEKMTFFGQTSIYVPETEILPFSLPEPERIPMQTLGPMQRVERQVTKERRPVGRKIYVPKRIPTALPTPGRVPTVTPGPMQRIERQVIKEKLPEEVYLPRKEEKREPISTVTKGIFQRLRKTLKKEEKPWEISIAQQKRRESSVARYIRREKEEEKLRPVLKKIYPVFYEDVLRKMRMKQLPFTATVANRVYINYIRTKPSEMLQGLMKGVFEGLVPIESLRDRILHPESILRRKPKLLVGKISEPFAYFATLILNPASPFRLLPGGKVVTKLGKSKALKIADAVLRKRVPEKLLPHAYRIMGNSLAGGINLPLLTLADKTIKTVVDPAYQLRQGLVETRKAIIPGVLWGAVIPEVFRGLGKGFTSWGRKIRLRRAGVQDKDIEPYKWAEKRLKTKDINKAKRELQEKIDEFKMIRPAEKMQGYEERIDNLREQIEAFSILNRVPPVTPKGKLKITEMVQGRYKYKIPFPRIPKLRVTTSQLQDTYDELRSAYIGAKDASIFDSKKELVNTQKLLKKVLGEKRYSTKIKMYDAAIKLRTDLKGAPGDIDKYWDTLNDPQKKLVILSQRLPREVKKINAFIEMSGKIAGQKAKSVDVIKTIHENWANRIWDPASFGKEKVRYWTGRKFATKSRHALPRKLSSILEGWSKGGKLSVHGATTSLQIYKEEMAKTIADKKFLQVLKKMKMPDGRPFLTFGVKYDDYRSVQHPNFRPYKLVKWTQALKEEWKFHKEFGSSGMVVRGGKPYLPQNVYVPKWAARDLNNMLMPSELFKVPGIAIMTKWNAILKAWTLQTSFFHNWAFLRSYLLGGNIKNLHDAHPFKAIKEGNAYIQSGEPLIREGIKTGHLTLGLKQDWNEQVFHEKTMIGKLLDKWKVSRVVKDKILDLRQQHADWLFGHFGAGLKAKAYMIELSALRRTYPNADLKALIKLAASLVNDDFGGLHLSFIGKGGRARNPTIQHIFRLFMLAPDWTESNIRSMVKTISAGSAAERLMYRHFWARILTKGAILSLSANFLINGQDTLDGYKRAYEEGRVSDVDVTNIYRALGGKPDIRKYFSVFGHFLDPYKFLEDPIKSAHYKGSKLFNIAYEALAGVDWAGRRFTTLSEYLGYDREKGVYLTTRKGLYKKGDPKYGKLKGKTVTWGFRTPSVTGSTFPSFILNQAFRSQPVVAQKLFDWLLGEAEGFDTILNMAGLQVRTTFGGLPAVRKKGFTLVGEEKKLAEAMERKPKVERAEVPEKKVVLPKEPVPVAVPVTPPVRKYPKYIKKGRKPLPYAAYTNAFSRKTAAKIHNMTDEERETYFKDKLDSSKKKWRDAAQQYLDKLKEKGGPDAGTD